MLKFIPFDKNIAAFLSHNDEEIQTYLSDETFWVFDDQFLDVEGFFYNDVKLDRDALAYFTFSSDMKAALDSQGYEAYRQLARRDGYYNLAVEINSFAAFDMFLAALDRNSNIEKLSIKINIPIDLSSGHSEHTAKMLRAKQIATKMGKLASIINQHPKITEIALYNGKDVKETCLNTFFTSLASNTKLKKLSLSFFDISKQESEALIYLLQKNESISHLGIFPFADANPHKKKVCQQIVKSDKLICFKDGPWPQDSNSTLGKRLEKNKLSNPDLILQKGILAKHFFNDVVNSTTKLLKVDIKGIKSEPVDNVVADDIRKNIDDPAELYTLIQNNQQLIANLSHHLAILESMQQLFETKIDAKASTNIQKEDPDFDKSKFTATLEKNIIFLKTMRLIATLNHINDEQMQQNDHHHDRIESYVNRREMIEKLWEKGADTLGCLGDENSDQINNFYQFFSVLTPDLKRNDNTKKPKYNLFFKPPKAEKTFQSVLKSLDATIKELNEHAEIKESPVMKKL